MKTWDDLSIKEKADIMGVAISNGITTLPEIKAKYNEFAEGGELSDDEYYTTMERVAEKNNPKWNQQRLEDGSKPLTVDEDLMRILNANDYNYRGYYNKYPQSTANADTHWTDEFKTAYHPSFSNQSIYSGKKSQYNPIGLPGGFWLNDESFIPKAWQYDANEYKSGGKIFIKPSHRGRFTELKKRTGHSATWFKQHGTPAQKKMAVFDLNSRHWKHGLGGNLFAPGGYVPTDKVKKRITQWEGAAMTGAIDPLSRKFLTNNSFEYEANAFTKALPENIREQILSNQELADNLYSYSYNVGAGKFKERVVPALLKYFAGEGSPYEIANSMWASGDKKLRGLRNRRGVEKKGVIDSLISPYPVEPTNSIVVSNPFTDIQQPIPAPIMIPDENQYVSVHTQTQEDIDRQEQQRAIERLNNIERFNRLMNLINVQNNPTPTFVPQNAPYTVNSNAFGGNIYDGTSEDSQQMNNEFPFGDQWLKEVPVYSDVERARRANNWLLNRGLVPRWSSLGNGKGTFSFLPQDQPIQQGLEIVSPEFDVLAMGNIFKPFLKATTKTILNNIKYLKGIDRYGNSYELPIRTLRGGINDVNGNIISDAELVDNWKRSQDFYKMRLRNAGLKQEAPVYIKNRDDAAKIIQKYDPSLSKAEALEQIDDGGGGYASTSTGDDGYAIITKELNAMGKQRRGTTNSAYVHEDAHLLRGPEDDGMEDITWSNLRLRKDEAAARGTQIKSMLGIKDNTPITSEQLKYMKDNFVRLTGMDNYMQLFLNSIEDFDNAAKWLSKYSYSLGGAMNLLDVLPHRKGKNIKGL